MVNYCFSHLLRLVDGSGNEELKEFISSSPNNVVKCESLNDELINTHLGNRDVTFTSIEGEGLFHHTRVLKDGLMVFLANSSLETSAAGTITAPGVTAVELNTIDGEIKGYPAEKKDKKVEARFSLAPAGSLLLFFPSRGISIPDVVPENVNTEKVIASEDKVIVTRDEPNALMIDFCDLELEGKTEVDMHIYDAADKVFKHYGFASGNPWNHSVQYKKAIVERDTFGSGTGFRVTYKFIIKTCRISQRYLLWWKDRNYGRLL